MLRPIMLVALASCGSSAAPPPPPAHRAGPPAKVRVVLYGTPDFTGDDPTRLRFIPLACAIEGKLAVGLPCAEAMPEKITAQIVGGKTIDVERTKVGYRDEAGDQDYPAPHGPECCSYNTCRGDTIPYLAAPHTAAPPLEPDAQGLVDHGGNHVVAIWPPDADVGLDRHAPTTVAAGAGPADIVLDQHIRVRGAALASGRGVDSERCRSCASLFHQEGSAPWQPVGHGLGHDGFVVMVTTDLDGDGHPEAVVREVWRNGYGLSMFGNDWSKAAHQFACGGI